MYFFNTEIALRYRQDVANFLLVKFSALNIKTETGSRAIYYTSLIFINVKKKENKF